MSNQQNPKAVRFTAFLYPRDRRIIEDIKEGYGLSTDSDAIRFALRLVGSTTIQVTVPAEAIMVAAADLGQR